MNRRIRDAGVTSYMEVVSESQDACERSGRVAAELGVDRLLGGTDIEGMKRILQGSDIAYYPFPGFPVDHPTKLNGKPEDIANGAIFLASEESSFITGTELVIDGGYLAVGGYDVHP